MILKYVKKAPHLYIMCNICASEFSVFKTNLVNIVYWAFVLKEFFSVLLWELLPSSAVL